MPFHRDMVQRLALELAAHSVYIGTSSWKYEGWLGQLYDATRYEYRGKYARTRFERGCLAEYAQIFRTVCVDAAYYDFPRPAYLEGLSAQVPDDFQFGFKVTDAITLKRFPNLPRFGPRAGQSNPDFLNVDRFVNAFLAPCEAIRPQVGVLIFEFSRFWPTEYRQGRDFVADLDRFLGQLPSNWPYAVEFRNRAWLQSPYFDCLSRHHVAHVFNSWDAMPSVNEQMAIPNSRTNPHLVAARFLLKPGRKYEDAVKSFHPYDQTREPYHSARAAGTALLREGQQSPNRKTFIFVNNRLEGNALETITAMLDGNQHPAP
jgi:uncharacterized protein YecE (DUF72 family)